MNTTEEFLKYAKQPIKRKIGDTEFEFKPLSMKHFDEHMAIYLLSFDKDSNASISEEIVRRKNALMFEWLKENAPNVDEETLKNFFINAYIVLVKIFSEINKSEYGLSDKETQDGLKELRKLRELSEKNANI